MRKDSRKNRRARVQSALIRYRSATFVDSVEQYCHDVSRDGVFVETVAPLPPGTLLRLELLFVGEPLPMPGVGRVVWGRDEQHGSPEAPAGMGIKFIKMDPNSQRAIARLLEVG